MDAFDEFFVSAGFMPHGYCFHWSPILLWSFVVSDGVIALSSLSYYSIPVALWTFVRRRTDLPFSWLFLMFALFIFACGTTHLIAILNIWQPDYWLDASVKMVTASASLATAVVIWPLIPRALTLPSPTQLERMNRDLTREIAARRDIEGQLQVLNHRLEERVAERTAELESANEALRHKGAELEQALRSIRDSEERTRSIVDAALDAVVTMSKEGIVVGWNPQAAATFGWTADEALGRLMNETIIPPRYRDAHVRGLQRYLRAGQATVLHRRLELSALHRDGHEFPIELAITPIGSGDNVCFSAFLRDITARKKAEQALRESEKHFRATFEQAAVGIAHVSPDGRWLRVNQRLCDIVGYGRDELLSLTFQDITHPDDLDTDLARVQQVLDGRIDTYAMEKRYLRRDGSQVWINLTVALVREEAGRPDYFISVVEDIERRKAAEEALQRLNADLERRVDERTAELQAANRELDSFSYAVSHDLRAPLRAMSGFSQALLEDHGERLDDEAHSYLDQIMTASRNMGMLVDGLLLLSRSTRGELQRDDVDLTAIAHTVRAELEYQEPGRKVAWHVEPGLRAWGDARTLASVMRNLLENAWKYTSHNTRAEIRVHVERCGGKHWFCVSDNGAGFDMKHADKLFKPFQRLHRQGEFPGIGIGLSTVQRIIQRHGGEIRAESEPNRWTTFSFTLPHAVGEQEPSPCA